MKRAFPLLLALVLQACSPTDDQPLRPAAAPSEPVSYPTSDYVEQAPGHTGGTLRISAAMDMGNLDLHLITGVNPKWLGRMLFDNLVYLDDKGEITPWLAKSWEISRDGLTYTFHLRDDVSFSDGEKFNAEAVLANLGRIRDPATRTGMTTAYIAPYVDGKVLDEFTFQARLSEPYTPFLNVLAQSWFGMMSPRALRENPKGLVERPVGTGPFVIEQYVPQQGISFVRRADYHWAPDFLGHQGPAYLERVELGFVPEAMIRYSSLASGQYDLTVDASPQTAAAIRANPALELHSRINLGNPLRVVTFNTEKAPFDDVRVRKAVALAIDREGLGRIIGFGEYRLKTDFLSATTRYYDPSFQDSLRFDPEQANRLLDQAGWTGRDAEGYRTRDGVRLTATVIASETPLSPAADQVAVQSDLKKIGFDWRIEMLPPLQAAERRNANQYQASGAGFWHTNTPDGLYILYHSRQITSPRYIGQNSSRIRDAQLDDLLGRARQSRVPEELKRLYSQAQQRLTEVVPAVPAYENHSLIAFNRQVKGVVFDTSHNTPFFTSVWLDREQP
ncbi:ABC transporter substrate-binding protein [Pseudomonas sp. GCM10022186]|uniref:ABC transporter substrate-binding protein n=1 Tax=Pseudomonas sp. GCM10022186 TaxID=3252650 RepID=UPI0036218C6F